VSPGPSSAETQGDGSSSPAQTNKPEVRTTTAVPADTPLRYRIVERESQRKGGSRYRLLAVNAVLDEASEELSEARARATLRALLDEVRRSAETRDEALDGVSAFLYQSRDHLAGGYPALGLAEWWPRGHSFSASNAANVADKAGYVEEIQLIAMPVPASSVVERLPKSRRKAIFEELVRAERRAGREAEARYPTDSSKMSLQARRGYDFKTAWDLHFALERKLGAQYQRALQSKYRITEEELNSIGAEAMSEKWVVPPP
jgi:hypothetical protein